MVAGGFKLAFKIELKGKIVKQFVVNPDRVPNPVRVTCVLRHAATFERFRSQQASRLPASGLAVLHGEADAQNLSKVLSKNFLRNLAIFEILGRSELSIK